MLPIANSTYFRNLLDSFSAGVVIVNRMGLVYASNAAAATLLGLSAEELADPQRSAALLGRTDAPRAVAHFLAAPIKHGRKPVPLTVTYRHPDGDRRHFHLSGSLLLENDKIFGILIEIADVTEIFRLHERDRAMLLGIQAAQRERIESLGQFSLAVAHQIRNPLMVIGGFAGRLLRSRNLDDPEATSLVSILDGAKRLETVVRAVSDYARHRDPRPVLADPADLATWAMDQARQRTGTHGPLHLEAAIGPIRTDPDLLREALVELFANALEAMEPAPRAVGAEPGTVTMRLRREGGTVRIAVMDQGPGLAEAVRPFVFDPFFTTKAVGVGMGLAMAKRDAEDLGGSLSLTNAPAGGCLAELLLPDGPAD